MWTAFKDWANTPFKTEMDAVHWALFLGFALAVVLLWTRVLAHLKIAVK